jgi:hypothetical protein
MLYTGDDSDVCAISFTPVGEIEQPVGFDSAHAYECECIVEWLTTQRSSNPMTGECIPPATPVAAVLHPLIVTDDAHVASTQAALDRAGLTVGGAGAVSWKAKFGWDAVFFVVFAMGNRWIGNMFDNVCLLVCTTLLMCAHYRAMGPWIVLNSFIAFVVTLAVGKLSNMYTPDSSEFVQLFNIELFSVKVSLDIVTTVIEATL